MRLNTHDVMLTKERTGGESLWISERVLVEELGISKSYLEQKARYIFAQSVSPAKKNKPILPDTGKSWRFARMEGIFWYDYDRIPAGRREGMPGREEILRMIAEKSGEERKDQIERAVKRAMTEEWRPFVNRYDNVNYEYSKKLAKACAVIEYARRATLEEWRQREFFELLAMVMDRVGVEYVPRNWRRLKEKVDLLKSGLPMEQIIKLPRLGNENARKYEDRELLSWLLYMRSLPQNYPNAFIIRKLRLMCSLAEKKVPSKSWCEQKLAEPVMEFLTSGRYGSGKLGDRYSGYIPMENALHAGDCWMVDGTRVNMLPYKTADGKDEFLYWIAVMDVHSGDILGVHFDTKEDRWGYLNALKMAVSHAGYLPYELVIDRFPGHNTEEIETLIARMEKLGTQVTISSKKTGKAKLERLFETIQSVFMNESAWYYGEGVQSTRSYAHRSPEYLKAQTKKRRTAGWDFDAAWREMTRVVELYRDTNLNEYSEAKPVEYSPRQLHQLSEKVHCKPVEIWDVIELFGLEKKVAISHAGLLKTKIQKVEYYYRVDEYDTIAHHRTVRVCYDMEDLGTVYLFENSDDINRAYLGTATEQRKAQPYGGEKDMRGVGEGKAHIERISKARKAHLESIVGEAGEDMNILLGAFAEKANKGDAENRWLEDRIGEWKDSKGKPRLLEVKDTDAKDEEDDEEVYALIPNQHARKQY